MTRRQTLVPITTTATLSLAAASAFAHPAAAVAANAGETLRRSAANLPGLGPADVYYPPSWQGSWWATRTVERPNNDPITLHYKVRFIPATPDSKVNHNKSDTLIVADRGFNQAQLETALRQRRQPSQQQQQQQSQPSDSSSLIVQSYEWDRTNPNDLRLQLVDGSRKEIKVTKRATSRSSSTSGSNSNNNDNNDNNNSNKDGNQNSVQSSEYQRITVEPAPSPLQPNAAGGGGDGPQQQQSMIPSISARRVLSQWKESSSSSNSNNDAAVVLEGLELVYDMGNNLDPLLRSSSSGSGASGGAEPKLLTKSRIVLERIP